MPSNKRKIGNNINEYLEQLESIGVIKWNTTNNYFFINKDYKTTNVKNKFSVKLGSVLKNLNNYGFNKRENKIIFLKDVFGSIFKDKKIIDSKILEISKIGNDLNDKQTRVRQYLLSNNLLSPNNKITFTNNSSKCNLFEDKKSVNYLYQPVSKKQKLNQNEVQVPCKLDDESIIQKLNQNDEQEGELNNDFLNDFPLSFPFQDQFNDLSMDNHPLIFNY